MAATGSPSTPASPRALPNRPSVLSDLQSRRQSMPAAPHIRPAIYSKPTSKLYSRAFVKTWHADHSASSLTWDGLRRDPHLCFVNGDCSVFLYRRGHSRRGPSFQIPLDCLIKAQCLPLLSSIYTPSATDKPQHSDKSLPSQPAELYLPAPTLATREEAFHWHLTTRNFFAWLCDRPLVGRHLGQALADLLNRMRQWRAPAVDCIEDVLIYADQMRYSAVENSPDHALAMLAFAELNQLRNVWIDAFTHCVGMNGRLADSTEFELVTRRSKALITRAFLEMDLHTDRAAQSLGTFLEDELSAANLGLGQGARRHLDNFRSLLQTHHVAKYGYWPPTRSSGFPKDLYLSMYVDFSNLYHLLADKESLEPWISNNGGICVQQNIDAFNARQRHEPLPYSLPLLPKTLLADGRTKSQHSLRAFVNSAMESTSRQFRTDRARASLRAATNTLGDESRGCDLVNRYIAFEDEQATKPDGDVSVADARRVRWLLIYGVLQTLVSLMSAPSEVRSTENSPYALCVLTEGIPPWEFESRASTVTSAQQTPVSAVFPPDALNFMPDGASTPPMAVEPDCEAGDFLRPRNDSIPDVSAKPDSAALRKSVSRASFLRRASSLRRRSLSVPPRHDPEASEFVSGRTLAELAFGQHVEVTSSLTSRSVRFDSALDEKRREGVETAKPDSTHSQVAIEDPSIAQEPQSPTTDEMQLLLPDANAVHHSPYASSEASSVPSLSLSSASREPGEDPLELEHTYIINSAAGKGRTDGDYSEHGFRVPRGFVKIRGPGVTKTMHSGNLPRSVTRGYDYFERPSGEESSSGANTPDSLPGAVDRTAVIALDGNIDDDAIETYRSLRT